MQGPIRAFRSRCSKDKSKTDLRSHTDFSYPGFFYEQTMGSWIDTLSNLGVETRDPGRGQSYGAFVATSAIDPSTYKRSYSKTGYLDSVETR